MIVWKSVIAAGLIALAASPQPADANCTQQEAMAKAAQFIKLLQTKMVQDPAEGQTLMGQMEPIRESYQGQVENGGTVNWDKVCSRYDALIQQAR